MRSYNTRVCHNLRLFKKNEQYTETKIEISCVNELFGGAHIHLGCTLHSSYLPHPFAFTSFPFDRLICFEKGLRWKGTE